MQSNYFTAPNPLCLDRIRNVLTRLEDTILFQLIERAQFAYNPRMYIPGSFPELVSQGYDGTWLEWYLKEIESFHAKARRYTSPDEYPFSSDLPAPVLESLNFPKILYPNDVNVNHIILDWYPKSIVPMLTRQASHAIDSMKRSSGVEDLDLFMDDGNYGSAATLDVDLLQTISKRVHYGKFVSESKFIENPAAFIGPIRSRDREALEALITKPEVERCLVKRVRRKATQYAVAFDREGSPTPVDAEMQCVTTIGKFDIENVIGELYEKYVIPLTKEVEVDYLLQRLDGLSEQEVKRLAMTPARA